MGKYIGASGLTYLWNKIKALISSLNIDDIVYCEADDSSAGGAESKVLPDSIIAEEDGLYQIKDNNVYPIAHPDISTQPSILSQRFGKWDIKEVLIKETSTPIQYNGQSLLNFNNTGPITCFDGTISLTDNSGNKAIVYRSIDEQMALCHISGEEYSVIPRYEWYQVDAFYSLSDLGTYNCIHPLYSIYPYFKYFIASTYDGSDLKYFKSVSTDAVHSIEEVTKDEIISAGYSLYNQTLDPIIPSSATVIEATSFNSETCIPAICKKVDGVWTISNNESILPDFTLVKYYEQGNDYYYYTSPSRTVIATFNGTSNTIPGLNLQDVYGNPDPTVNTEDVIGQVIVNLGDNNSLSYDLIISQIGSTINCTFGFSSLYLSRGTGGYSTYSNCPYDITVKMYSL